MNNKPQHGHPSSGMSLGDIYFVLFRHKWKIIILSAAGIIGGIVFYHLNPPPFVSEAKLFIRYVLDSGTATPNPDASKMTTSAANGAGIINSEIEILSSLDLAEEVVDTIGASNILAKAGGGGDRVLAAGMVRGGLSVGADGTVLVIDFRHPDPQIVQPVLQTLIDDYIKKHIEVHEGVGLVDDFLARQTSQLRSQIDQTEQELQDAKAKAGIVYPEDANKMYSQQIAKIHDELFDAESRLAESQMKLSEMKASPVSAQATNTTDSEISADKLEKYRQVCMRLDVFQKREVDYLTQGYSEDNVLVKELHDQIANVKKLKEDFEKENPNIAGLRAPDSNGDVDDVPTETGRIAGLESQIKVLNSRLAEIRSEAVTASADESAIADLEQKKDLQESNYKFYSSGLEQVQISEALSSGKISNISPIQLPSPPFKASSKIIKTVMMIIGAGFASGLGLAFLLELFLDRSVKRPSEIENKLQLPLILSIPYISNGNLRRIAKTQKRLQLENTQNKEVNGSPEENSRLEVAEWNGNHVLHPFYEALRDRLITYFESKNVTRKPKLVAVTSPSKGSGVSTIAVGLAASLSETGDGSVLLVSMNSEHDIGQEFYKGRPNCKLDDVLENGKRENALVQENLYVVTEGAGGGEIRRLLPKRFMTFLPKLKVSDYDYIIFDMPPITQTSITPRLAGFMDMTLIVVESEKTDQDLARRASALLLESKANISIVLNKTRKYVPTRVHQEFLSDT